MIREFVPKFLYTFKDYLETKGNLQVILEDERLTTVMVNRAMISGNVRRENRKQKRMKWLQ